MQIVACCVLSYANKAILHFHRARVHPIPYCLWVSQSTCRLSELSSVTFAHSGFYGSFNRKSIDQYRAMPSEVRRASLRQSSHSARSPTYGAMSYDSNEFRLDSTDSSDRLLVYSKLSCCFKANNNKAILTSFFKWFSRLQHFPLPVSPSCQVYCPM